MPKTREGATVAVRDAEGREVEKLDLKPSLFDGEINEAVLHQAVRAYSANLRRGTASTRTRGEVKGSGRKPWRQKGTGRARVGSIRSPLWRGGGIVFGPHPRDFSQGLPQALRRLALKSALNLKLKEGHLHLVDAITMAKVHTKTFFAFLKKLGLEGRILVLLSERDRNVLLSARNIEGLAIGMADTVNAFHILNSEHVIFTKDSLARLEKRFGAGSPKKGSE